ncbi:MAG: glycine cleavage system aminomethyltransferase GcvT [Planctomycetota bacterium]
MAAVAESAALSRTPLAEWHAANRGRLVDFAGWSMPVQYGSIVEEHHATRRGVGLFDVSHMGRFHVAGADSGALLDRLLSRGVSRMPVGRIRYALVCNDAGGVLDDVLAWRRGDDDFSLVVNASNRDKLWAWFTQHAAAADATLKDETIATAMIAVQGPEAVATVVEMADSNIATMKYYTGGDATVGGVACRVSRTGYTGEDGYELVCDAAAATGLWESLVAAGGKPCGLASRDTLRLEAAMPLYGHELDEDHTPLEAGLDFAVQLLAKDGSPRDFIGGDALRTASVGEPASVRIGLQVDSRRPPREGYAVLHEGAACGHVTSGTASPTLGTMIAMASVTPAAAEAASGLSVEIRGANAGATLTPLPFYRRA